MSEMDASEMKSDTDSVFVLIKGGTKKEREEGKGMLVREVNCVVRVQGARVQGCGDK